MPNRPVVAQTPLSIISGVLSAAVATGGTFTPAYPLLQPGTNNPQTKNKGHFFGAGGHKLLVNNSVYSFPTDFELTYNAPSSGITVTWRNATTLPAGSTYKLQLNEMNSVIRAGNQQQFPGQAQDVSGGHGGTPGIYLMNLGAAVAGAAADICAAQSIGGAVNATINGTRAVSGVAYMDVARTVQVVSANAGDTTQTVTVYGTDKFGNSLRENIALNGTTPVLGKKAFWTITRVAVSAATAGNLSVGASNVLGLPAFLPGAGYIVKEIQDGAAATAGTTVAGASVTPSATSADVRGNYTPNATPDGTKAMHLLVWLQNPNDIGGSQFNG